MNTNAIRIFLFIFFILFASSVFGSTNSKCLKQVFDRSSWSFNSKKAHKILIKKEILRQETKGSLNTEIMMDAYTGKVHNLYMQDQNGKLLLNMGGVKVKNMHIDHVVPLKFMHDHGGCFWSLEKKLAFANDPINLKYTTATQNISKGPRGPAAWLPENNKARLRYLKAWRKIADKYSGIPMYNWILGANILRSMKISNPKLFARTTKLLSVTGRAVIVIGALHLTYTITKEGYDYYKKNYSNKDEFQFSLEINNEEDWLNSQVY